MKDDVGRRVPKGEGSERMGNHRKAIRKEEKQEED